MIESDQQLDVSGLNCPLPILRTKKALATMSSGQVLHVIATDPGSKADFPVFTRQTGHDLLAQSEEGSGFHFWIRKL